MAGGQCRVWEKELVRQAGHPGHGGFGCQDRRKSPSCHLGMAEMGNGSRRKGGSSPGERGLAEVKAMRVWRRESIWEMSLRWHQPGCVMDCLRGVRDREDLTI